MIKKQSQQQENKISLFRFWINENIYDNNLLDKFKKFFYNELKTYNEWKKIYKNYKKKDE